MRKLTLVLLILSSLTLSATLTVPGEYPTIQSAINASTDGDTVLVALGEHEGPINFFGKRIVVRSLSMNPNSTILWTFFPNHCVSFTSGEDSTSVLEGFTISNGSFDGDRRKGDQPPPDFGGGIYIVDSSPTIRGNIIRNCTVSARGTGIYCRRAYPRIEGNTIRDNTYGGGYGGGIYVQNDGSTGSITIVGNIIESNEATYGAGIYIADSDANIFDNTIIDNTASSGGGLYCMIFNDSISLCGNLISDNYASIEGGAACSIYGKMLLIGNMITTNTVGGNGGGLNFYQVNNLILVNNTITANTASQPSYGVGGVNFLQCDSVEMMNNIVWGNFSPVSHIPNVLVFDSNISIDYCNIGGGLDSIWVDTLSVLTWGTGNIDVDPLFEIGPLSDYHLSEGSPCIDIGNPAPEYNDPEDPFNPGYALWPAMGYLRNDMGAYGGRGVDYILSVEEEEGPSIPGLLLMSYPNPFTSSCTICFEVPEAGLVSLGVYDLTGRLVRTLFEGEHPVGVSSALFDGSTLPSGVYVVVFRSSDQMVSHRCVLVR